MDSLGLSMLLGVVLAVLIWRIVKFLGWEKFYLGWEKFFRKGVIVDGHIWAHRRQSDKDNEDDEDVENMKRLLKAGALLINVVLLALTWGAARRGLGLPLSSRQKSVEYFLMYTYDYNGTNYLHEQKVSEALYQLLKDGDSVKVCCLPQNPMIAQLESVSTAEQNDKRGPRA